MEVFSWYFMTVKPYVKLFLCFYRVCFAAIYILILIFKLYQYYLTLIAEKEIMMRLCSLNKTDFFSCTSSIQKFCLLKATYIYELYILNTCTEPKNNKPWQKQNFYIWKGLIDIYAT